jgi:hypothetical protein
MRIVDKDLLEWIKARVEETGPQGYYHGYELFSMKGKCLQKWHGDYRSDPHQLAIWIFNVAWFYGDDQYKVMEDRSAVKEEDFKSFHLKISRDQDLFSDTVHDEGLVKLYKWYDALAHRFTLEKLELHQAHALLAWEKHPRKDQHKRQDWPCFEAEWLDLAKPNDELIADVYKAAHGGLERSNKLSGLTWDDTYSVLCFIEGNPVPAKFNFEITLQMALLKDKDFKIPFVSLDGDKSTDTRKGKDEMNYWFHDAQLKHWLRTLGWTPVKVEVHDAVSLNAYERLPGAQPKDREGWGSFVACWDGFDRWAEFQNGKDGTDALAAVIRQAIDAHVRALRLEGALSFAVLAWAEGDSQPKRLNLEMYLPIGPKVVPRAWVTPEAPVPGIASGVDWLAKVWPLAEQAVELLIHERRHPHKPYSYELHERFIAVHERFLEYTMGPPSPGDSRQNEMRAEIGKTLMAVLPGLLTNYLYPNKSREYAVLNLVEKLFSGLDEAQMVKILETLTDEQKVLVMELIEDIRRHAPSSAPPEAADWDRPSWASPSASPVQGSSAPDGADSKHDSTTDNNNDSSQPGA